jgi:hypothetical protein
MAKRYVKKANEIQAVQYNGTNAMEIVDFVDDVIGIDWYKNTSLEITTDNEVIACDVSDYIVKNNKGKFRVYEANEFEKDYGEVEEDD